MKKRVLSLVLAAVMVCALLPTVASAAEEDFQITDGVLVKYNGPGGDVVIPSGVTAIGNEAFEDCTSLTSVTIPDSVTSIGNWAFLGCVGLTSVTIPDSVTSIRQSAFCRCKGLTSVTIPDSVTSIRKDAFSGCKSLTSVVIPNSVTSIEESAFSYCTSLTSVTIPDSVTSIKACAFYKCTSLTSVTIPNSVTSIEESAFSGCTSLTSVTIGNGVTSIGWRVFKDCSGLTDVYYGGTGAQWKAIRIGNENDPLQSVTIHYNSTGAPAPAPAAPVTSATNIAYPSTQSVLVDGVAVEFQCYALKDENGNDTNYIKLRDLADILNGSAAQFQVGWDGSVTITTGQGYTKNGTEQNTPFSGQRAYEKSASATVVDGAAADLDAIVLTDDAGGGYTYYKLRDLGAALDFKVDWTAERGIFIETR